MAHEYGVEATLYSPYPGAVSPRLGGFGEVVTQWKWPEDPPWSAVPIEPGRNDPEKDWSLADTSSPE